MLRCRHLVLHKGMPRRNYHWTTLCENRIQSLCVTRFASLVVRRRPRVQSCALLHTSSCIAFTLQQQVCRPRPANASSHQSQRSWLESTSQADEYGWALWCEPTCQGNNERRNSAHQNDAPTLGASARCPSRNPRRNNEIRGDNCASSSAYWPL